MPIRKEERVLIVISYLAAGDTDYLYRFIDEAGRGTAQATLFDDYAKIVKLYDANATSAKLINALRREGAKDTVKRIDLLVLLHGYPGRIGFSDGSKRSAVLKDEILALNIRVKLRLVYSTCCYGDSHSGDFIAAGFDAAIGSKKVNSASAVEFAPLLSLWQWDNRLCDCLAPSIPLVPASDVATRIYAQFNNMSWKDDVDSTKVIQGNANLKIST
jgi:hypothetical protein